MNAETFSFNYFKNLKWTLFSFEGKEVGVYTNGFKDIAEYFNHLVSNTEEALLSQRTNKIMDIKEETKKMTWNQIKSYIHKILGTPNTWK